MKKFIAILTILMTVLVLNGCESDSTIDAEDLFNASFVDGVFHDEIAEFTFHLPNGWRYFPESELRLISQDMSERSGETMVYTMIANDQTNDTGVVMIWEEMVGFGQRDWNAINEIIMIADMYHNRADVREISSSSTVTIGGHEYERIRIYFYEFQGLTDGTLTFFARRIENFMFSFSISGSMDNNVLEYFE